jgi:2-phospho-L-lactate guanylyltransferase
VRLDRARVWTIVPVRGFAAGKSRLAPALSTTGRAALNRELLVRTLAVIGEWCGALARCIVVSPSLSALRLARSAGATPLYEGTRAVGLNRAIDLGLIRARARGATHALILAGDLPRLTARALAEMERAARHDRCVVLAPDKTGTGTNALLVGVDTGFAFAFGPDSFLAHRAAAERAGLGVRVVRRRELEFDLDLPADLAAWRRERVRRAIEPPLLPQRRNRPYPRQRQGVTMHTHPTGFEEER